MPNGKLEMGWDWSRADAGERQSLLHPDRTKVYPHGDTPPFAIGTLSTTAHFEARGWGEVSAMSYREFLIWLEYNLNAGGTHSNHAKLNTVLQEAKGGLWNPQKTFKPLTAKESDLAEQWTYPVHACGYNWLDDNAKAAQRLGKRIDEVIQHYSNEFSTCKQVILLTHSMGGLVARYCSEVDNEKLKHKAKRDKIAGIIHGVMPAAGAAVAYRRCKVGMWEESALTSLVIGSNGREVTAVFAQAPGALQLLPSKQYPVRNWLEVRDTEGTLLPDQPKTDDPYASVYSVRDKWWGLVKEEWLKPREGVPITWSDYLLALDKASNFHDALADHYHANTFGFYGSAHIDSKSHRVVPNSFSKITWTMRPGNTPRDKAAPSTKQIMAMGPNDVEQSGNNPVTVPAPDAPHVGIPATTVLYSPMGETSGIEMVPATYYAMHLGLQDGSGDGTVPAESARHPLGTSAAGKIVQLFNISGIDHEGAYNPLQCKQLTVYAINKIAAPLPLPKKGKP